MQATLAVQCKHGRADAAAAPESNCFVLNSMCATSDTAYAVYRWGLLADSVHHPHPRRSTLMWAATAAATGPPQGAPHPWCKSPSSSNARSRRAATAAAAENAADASDSWRLLTLGASRPRGLTLRWAATAAAIHTYGPCPTPLVTAEKQHKSPSVQVFNAQR